MYVLLLMKLYLLYKKMAAKFDKNIMSIFTSRERLRTPKVFTKDQCFSLGCRGFSVESCVLDVY